MSLKQYVDNNLVAEVTSAGERTEVLQPAFFAYLAGATADITGNGTIYTIGSGATAFTKVYDQGGDFNVNGTFTAPKSGRYFLATTTGVVQTGGGTSASYRITTSNQLIFNSNTIVNQADHVFSKSGIFDMDAGDTATTGIAITGVGADTSDLTGGANATSHFSGALLV